MNLSSAYIGIGILALIILPFYLSSLKRKKNSNRLTKEFIACGLKYGIELSETDHWKDRLIGLDNLKRKLLFRHSNDGDFTETLIDLNDVSSCSVEISYLKTLESEKAIDRIEILFKMKNKSLVSVSIYNSETDMMVYSELEIAEKWLKACQELLR